MRVYVALHKGTTWMSRAVKFFSRGDYSHASLLLPDGTHVEALQWRGVVCHKTFTYEANDASVEFFPIEVTAEQLTQIQLLILEELGAGYDWYAILLFLLRSRRTSPSPTRWYCSELLVYLLETVRVRLFRDLEPWETTPTGVGQSIALPEEAMTLAQVLEEIGAGATI